MKICYNGKDIGLFYFPYFPKNKEAFLKVKVKGSGYKKIKLDNYNVDEYQIVEEEAQLYLIKNAIDKRKAGYPDKIVAIMQNIICNQGNDHLELEIILTGLAFFKKIN